MTDSRPRRESTPYKALTIKNPKMKNIRNTTDPKNIYTQKQHKTANKSVRLFLAYGNVYSHKAMQIDKRTKLSRLQTNYLIALKGSVNKEEIILKRKERAQRKPTPFKNIFNNPLVIDLTLNLFYVKHFYENYVNFGHRNHHAKSVKDIRIIQIFKNKKESYKKAV